MQIKMILATDLNGCIGYKNELVFKAKKDLRRFKDLTTNNIVEIYKPSSFGLHKYISPETSYFEKIYKNSKYPSNEFIFSCSQKYLINESKDIIGRKIKIHYISILNNYKVVGIFNITKWKR